MPIEQTLYHGLAYDSEEWTLRSPNGAACICWVNPSISMGNETILHICSNRCPMFESSFIDTSQQSELTAVVKLHCRLDGEGKPLEIDVGISMPKVSVSIEEGKGTFEQLRAAMNS